MRTTLGTGGKQLIRVAASLLVFALVASYSVQASQPASVEAAGTNYYVDSVAGSDSNNGTSQSSAWRSLSPVNGRSFSAGDTVYFARGSSWSGNLTINSSGASGNPITLKAYGSGNAPAISYPNVQYGHAIDVNGSYVVVQDFLARDANEAGISVNSGANNVVVQNNEITKSGEGVQVKGGNALVTRNYIHDLTMVVNTPTNVNNNDDYGAEGIFLSNASNTEISYNRFVNCKAPSYDYGYDGGVIEFWGNVSGTNVHHNFSTGSNGYFEIGGGSSNNITMSYNVSSDGQDFAMLHLSGPFGSTVSNFKVDNNTIVRTDANYRVLDFGGNSGPSGFYFRNNVVYGNTSVASSDGFNHNNNVYYLYGGAGLGSMGLGSGEKQADPNFVNASGGDYHLQSTSPAINAGASLGYAVDFDGKSISSPPDAGAYEYGSAAPAPTATAVPPTATSVPPTATLVPGATAVPPTATPAPAPAPAGSILWRAGMEGGDFSEWTSGNGGKVSGWGNNSTTISKSPAHTGADSAGMTISGVNTGSSSAAQLVRQAESHANPNAYYSVWYYVPQAYTPTAYWDLMDFYSVLSSGANQMWTLNVGNRADGSMFLYMFDQTNRVSYGAASANVPVGKWFNVEVYYQQATGTAGRVTVYQDGQQIMDMNGVATRRSGDQIDWVVTNSSDNLNPSTATLYVDDAAISTGYMDPGASTSTVAPTATPVPTQTVVPPTATPAPTQTAVPATATPAPTTVPPTTVPPTATPAPTTAPAPTATATAAPTATATAAPAPSASTGLVGQWNMDEGSGTTTADSSGSGNTGTLYSGPSWVAGVVGKALGFNGTSSYARVNSSSSLSPLASTGEMTIATWVKLNQRPSTSGQGRSAILAKGSSNNYEYGLYAYANGQVGFSVWNLNGNSYAEPKGGSISLNQWHRLVGTVKKGQFVRVYLDGSLVGESTTLSGSTGSGSSPLYFARRGDGQYSNSVLDGARIWNRVLSLLEIQGLK